MIQLGTVGRPMPGVVIRIARESTTSPIGYETLVEADSDNTKIETKSKFLRQRKKGEFFFQIPRNQLKVNC